MPALIPAILFLEPRSILGWIVVGFIAGALATRVVGTRLGCLMSILIGVAGAFVGAFLASLVGFNGDVGFFGEIVVAFIGAVVLLALIRAVRHRR
ncbi:MAG: GlsB/YeaQ/YmgE family stress response membrane protein [Candidatus Dormibacteraeota bacterium]|nr:GlsB/YeaQ/YmgE family stress response membrane protein [Candidatus Dormibacteraeota bacterium]